MHRGLILLLFLLPASLGFSGSANAQLAHQMAFSENDLSFDRRNGFDLISLKGCVSSQEVGHPNLPLRFVHLMIPIDRRAAEVYVTDESHVMLSGEYLIAPSQPDQRTNGSHSKGWTQPDPQVYDSDSLYPSRLVEIVDQGYLAGNHLVTLAIRPLQYQPKSRKLFFYTQLAIRVELERSEVLPLSSRVPKRSARAQRLYHEILHHLVVNKPDIPHLVRTGFQSAPSGLGGRDSSYYSYLVITSSELESAFLPLVDWKIKKGVNAAIVCLDSIVTGYAGRDDAEKIRNFLIGAYLKGTLWVLLGGDEDVVPVRYAYPSNVSTPPSVSDQQICDLYFSDVDGDWDKDNDGIWGEPQHDDPDIYPDLFVGRVPCSDPEEAQAFVEKLLCYERNPGDVPRDYLTRALWMSSDQMADWDGGNGQHNLVAQYMPSHFYQDLTTLIESPTGDAENPVGPDGETCTGVMNQGWGIIGVLAHGKASGFVAKSNWTNGNPKSWVLTLPGEGDGHGYMPNLENVREYGIMYSISCSQSAIDVDKYPFLGGEPSVGEFYPLASQKAGVAFLGYSRWGWVSISYKLFEKFLESLFDGESEHHLGVAEALSRCAYPSYRDIDYGHNLFGDPEMPVWTQIPGDLMAIHPEEVTVGKQTIGLSVTSQGAGVSQARVCLVLQGGIRFLGETDQDGNLSCEIDLDEVGEMSLVVTKPNFIPYQDSITVSLVADVDDDEKESEIEAFELSQNYPNPFNPLTRIQFVLPKRQTPIHATLRIYNILGQVVRTLVDGPMSAGVHVVNWDGKDFKGKELASGIYHYRLKAGGWTETRRMTLMK